MPFYHKTEGQPSNSLHVQTLADVPSAPPGNVRADVLNATAVELKWAPPPPQVIQWVKIYSPIPFSSFNDQHST